ncbi:MAG: hypothetical protein FJ012_01730 [Chloroflexi bacterium]|nr:hypothetical protein [Chloroflexota bacterium]
MKKWVLLIVAVLLLLSPATGGCGKKEYSLTIAVNGQGTTDPSAGTYAYNKGEDVTITATPAFGWRFDHWSGDASGTNATVAIHIDGNKRVTANFSRITYSLTMAVNGSGAVDPTVGDHIYDPGTVVNIVATAGGGWQFINWSGDVADPFSAATTVTLHSSKTVAANFSQIPPLTISTLVEVQTATMTYLRNPLYPEGYQNSVPHLAFPQHPYLAPNGKSNMHNDAYMSDTYEISGPLGINPEVIFQRYGDFTNLCVTITFDSNGRILTVNARPDGYYVLAIDPDTLEELASYLLPPRHADDPLYPYYDTSGGAYFVLDNQDRILVADADNAIQVIQYVETEGQFELVRKYEMENYLVPMELPTRDHVQMAIPDWSGQVWWFATRFGIVGTLDPESGQVHTIELVGEEMQNSFTVGEDGVYIVTDHAMYRFHADVDGQVVQDWRTAYDRGTHVKPGMINQGSGTTPTLFGDMVAIADNADPRMNILFLRRTDGALVGKIPVFEEGQSTTENSTPGWVRQGEEGLEYSVIVENNYGRVSENIFAPGGIAKENVGGISRIDLVPDGMGGYTCKEIWRSAENSPTTVPKVSLANGMLYLYTYELLPGDDYAWYLAALDVETGETVFKIPTGTGLWYTDFGAPITLSPDGKTVHIGTLGGLLCIRDGKP